MRPKFFFFNFLKSTVAVKT